MPVSLAEIREICIGDGYASDREKQKSEQVFDHITQMVTYSNIPQFYTDRFVWSAKNERTALLAALLCSVSHPLRYNIDISAPCMQIYAPAKLFFRSAEDGFRTAAFYAEIFKIAFPLMEADPELSAKLQEFKQEIATKVVFFDAAALCGIALTGDIDSLRSGERADRLFEKVRQSLDI